MPETMLKYKKLGGIKEQLLAFLDTRCRKEISSLQQADPQD